jgi:hypothetical protein
LYVTKEGTYLNQDKWNQKINVIKHGNLILI